MRNISQKREATRICNSNLLTRHSMIQENQKELEKTELVKLLTKIIIFFFVCAKIPKKNSKCTMNYKPLNIK